MTQEEFDKLLKHTDLIFNIIGCENKCNSCKYFNLCRIVIDLQGELSKVFTSKENAEL